MLPSYTLQSFRSTQVCNLGGFSLGSSAGGRGQLTYVHVCTCARTDTHVQIHTRVFTHLPTAELSPQWIRDSVLHGPHTVSTHPHHIPASPRGPTSSSLTATTAQCAHLYCSLLPNRTLFCLHICLSLLEHELFECKDCN